MKINIKFASVALVLGMAAAMTSCHRNNAIDIEQKANVQLIQNNTLQVKFTSAVSGATVTYAGQTATKSGNTYTFNNAAASGTVVVTLPAGYVAISPIDVTFGDRKIVVIELTPVQKSTNAVSQAAADANNDVTNDNKNQKDFSVKATLNLNGSNATYTSSDSYRITVYVQPQEPVEEVKENTEYPVSAYSVDCDPDGTKFSGDGAHLDLDIEGVGEVGLAGIDFRHVDGTKANNLAVAGDVLSADLPHFSTWNVILNATCTAIETNKIILKTGNLTPGNQTVNFDQYFGFTNVDKLTGILSMWTRLIFGATAAKVPTSGTLNMERAGTYTIYQNVSIMTFKAGNKVFRVKVYGDISTEIVYTEEPVATHVGGSN